MICVCVCVGGGVSNNGNLKCRKIPCRRESEMEMDFSQDRLGKTGKGSAKVDMIGDMG